MAKKKNVRTVTTPKLQKKAHLITWVVFLALFLGLAGGYLIAKAKYINKIGVISVMFNQKDTELNQMKAELNKMKSSDQQVEF